MKQITVPIPLSQLDEIHDIWSQFTSVLDIAENDSGSATMAILLRPLADRMTEVVIEKWETLMDEAKNGGAQ